ncbi:MAG TPA: zinc-binding dehydrogenase [Chloroflexota bacterium]|jgi:L-iditol 2-dehydrogenase|nr:zinc-binding dehydrogenase [Chloroflexota bacterium]
MSAVVAIPAEQTCAVWYGGSELRVERRPLDALGPTQVLVEVALCGVCGTDVHILDGEFPMYNPPRVLGHEFSGTVRAVGLSVTRVAVGDPVAVEPSLPCGVCFFCHESLPYMCASRTSFHGGFGEYTIAPEGALFPLPAGVSLDAAALSEPLSCCVHTINRAALRVGDRVAIIGAGIIGLLLLQLARRAGAARILVSDPAEHRRETAVHLGADLAVDPTSTDVAAAARDLTGGIGADVALEAVGSARTVQDALSVVRRGGTVVVMGVAPPSAEVAIRPYDLFDRELTIKGAFIRAFEFRRTVELLPLLELESLITDTFSIDQAPRAIENVRARRGIKTAIRPH